MDYFLHHIEAAKASTALPHLAMNDGDRLGQAGRLQRIDGGFTNLLGGDLESLPEWKERGKKKASGLRKLRSVWDSFGERRTSPPTHAPSFDQARHKTVPPNGQAGIRYG